MNAAVPQFYGNFGNIKLTIFQKLFYFFNANMDVIFL